MDKPSYPLGFNLEALSTPASRTNANGYAIDASFVVAAIARRVDQAAERSRARAQLEMRSTFYAGSALALRHCAKLTKMLNSIALRPAASC